MAPTRWLCISNRTNDEITRKKQVWGVAKRFINVVSLVKKSDTLLMYTIQEVVDREVVPSAITSCYEAVTNMYEDESPLFITPKGLGIEVFPLRIKMKPVKIFVEPLPFKPLISEMSFIKNKVMWSGSIRTAMRVIPEEDHQRIMKEGN